MIKLDVNTDAAIQLTAKLERLSKSAFPSAVRNTLNEVAFEHKRLIPKVAKQKFKNERNNIIDNLNNLIGIDENNNCFFLYELEKKEDVKKYLSDNIDDIKKYYKVGKWGFFSNDILKGKDNYIGLLRSLYLDSDYEIISKSKIATFENIKKQYTMWDFRKK